ncbi:MAG: GxxExxY protein [Planctomycetes bacterium]|nr:GxxExxY protein [Planctomycetota bacterium]
MPKIIHKKLSYTVRGVLLNVHNTLGPMLPEGLYQKAIVIAVEAKGIACQAERPFEVYYRNQRVGLYYVDIWIEGGKIILELKVAPQILPLHQAQAISYLKVTDADLAIVVNFGAESLEDKRLPNFLRDKVVSFEWEKRPVTTAIPYPDLTNHLLKICHRVHFELGPGFFHQIYRRAAMIELAHQELNYRYIKKMPITYQGHSIGMQDVRLISVADKILLATVAVKQIDRAMKTQLKIRLKHLGFQFGLLANFNDTTLDVVTVQV